MGETGSTGKLAELGEEEEEAQASAAAPSVFVNVTNAKIFWAARRPNLTAKKEVKSGDLHRK